MGRYDVHPAPDGAHGFIVNIQSNTLSDLPTRIVVPLVEPSMAPQPARRLNPIFTIRGKAHMLLPQYASSILASELSPAIASLADDSDSITAALDMLLFGF